jgi:hypothetical protein
METMKLLAVSAVFALGIVTAPAAFAEPVLDFAMIAPATGLISHAGGDTALVGTKISLQSVAGLGTPAQNGITRNCLNCFLDFTTGNRLSWESGYWNFGGGGDITVTGTVDLNNNGMVDADDATGTLMSGNFGNAGILGFGSLFKIAGASTTIVLNPTLTNFYGTDVMPFTYQGGFNLSFMSMGASPTGGFSSLGMLSGDVIAATPEPLSIALLGTALLGWGIINRRKRANS